MSFWNDHPTGDRELLRLLTSAGKWIAWSSKEPDPNDPADKRIPGCQENVEEALQAALHSTNVVVLLGSGASFCAKNHGESEAPSMWDLWHAVREAVSAGNVIDHAKFDDLAKRVMGNLPEDDDDGHQKAGDIELLLSLCKMSIELLEVRAEGDSNFNERGWLTQLVEFVSDAEKAILKRVDFVSPTTELQAHTTFIRKFARRSPEKPRVKLFTTNYDLCLETASSRLGVVLVDGFSHSAIQRFNRDHFHHDIVRRSATSAKVDFLDGVFHLYKLHGSVDWRRQEDELVIRSRQVPDEKLKPVLIYPRSTKYQEAFETPYLDMFAALQAALREPDTTLIVSGFGFADDHISAPIWSAVETNLSLRLVLCDRGFVPDEELEEPTAHGIDLEMRSQRPYQKKLIGLVQQGDARISLLNGRFEDLAQAVPEISGKTDRQLLQERLDRVRDATS